VQATVIAFAWGDVIRNGTPQSAQYVRRIYRGLARWSTLPWRMVLFVNHATRDLPVPAGVEKRVFDLWEWQGCLPKLYAHSAEAGLSGRVLLLDLDTIICGDVDPFLAWRGAFCSRADEAHAAHGRWQSGGNIQSFIAGETRHLWERYRDRPAKFARACRGCERYAIQQHIAPQTFFQAELPGRLKHLERECEGKKSWADAKGASVIIATGELRPHLLPANPIRREWDALDNSLYLRLVETGERHRNHIAALYEPQFRARLADCGVRIVDDGECDASLVHAVGAEDGTITPDAPPPLDRMIVLEKVDGAQIHPAHVSWLAAPGVIGWMKSYTPRACGIMPALQGRYHAAVLAGKGKPQAFPPNVETWYGFARYENCRAFAAREPDWTADRPIAVQFRGRVEFPYPGGAPIAAHREACMAAIRQLPYDTIAEAHRWTGSASSGYVDELYHSRVIASPWGYGEACVRDYEALLAGCILIKPAAPWVTGLTDIAPHVLFCAPDWSDLPRVAERALVLHADIERRKAARALVLQEWDDAVLAQRIAGRLWRIARRAGINPPRREPPPEVAPRPTPTPDAHGLVGGLPPRRKVCRGR